MRPKYKIGETVFFNFVRTENGAEKTTQSFGVINGIQINIRDKSTQVIYMTDGAQFGESDVLGKAIIQKPRTRKARAKKVIEQMKAVASASEPAQASIPLEPSIPNAASA